MSKQSTQSAIADAPNRLQTLLILNGSLVLLLGLISGIGLLIEVLNAIDLWPVFIALESGFPGTQKGWQLAHVAGVMNGILMIIGALLFSVLNTTRQCEYWITISLIYTGWGNSIFFHCANFSSNRALALNTTQLGEPDTIGAIGYFFGASTIPFTITAFILFALIAYRQLRIR